WVIAGNFTNVYKQIWHQCGFVQMLLSRGQSKVQLEPSVVTTSMITEYYRIIALTKLLDRLYFFTIPLIMRADKYSNFLKFGYTRQLIRICISHNHPV